MLGGTAARSTRMDGRAGWATVGRTLDARWTMSRCPVASRQRRARTMRTLRTIGCAITAWAHAADRAAVQAGSAGVPGRGAASRRWGRSRSPTPKASQQADTRSALASASSLARFGMVAPVSVDRTKVSEVFERWPSCRRDSPRAWRTSDRRSGRPAQRDPSMGSHGCSTPKASRQGEIRSAKASFSRVSTRGIRSPLSIP